jgi:ABC-type antimicrobial peptide transport system permease subunit
MKWPDLGVHRGRDPWTIVVALTVLTSATISAVYLSARRAATIDPIVALRGQ